MSNIFKRPILKSHAIAIPVLSGLLLAGCVSQSKYDALDAQNQQLQQKLTMVTDENNANMAAISRLQGAIKYTVNSDQLFASGSWKMSPQGQQIIATMATKLAPTQQNKIKVSGFTDNAPIGAALAAQGVTTNKILSQKRAEAVMEFLIAHGMKPDLVVAQGYGEANPVASNATAKGRAKNRRVELSLGG